MLCLSMRVTAVLPVASGVDVSSFYSLAGRSLSDWPRARQAVTSVPNCRCACATQTADRLLLSRLLSLSILPDKLLLTRLPHFFLPPHFPGNLSIILICEPAYMVSPRSVFFWRSHLFTYTKLPFTNWPRSTCFP